MPCPRAGEPLMRLATLSRLIHISPCTCVVGWVGTRARTFPKWLSGSPLELRSSTLRVTVFCFSSLQFTAVRSFLDSFESSRSTCLPCFLFMFFFIAYFERKARCWLSRLVELPPAFSEAWNEFRRTTNSAARPILWFSVHVCVSLTEEKSSALGTRVRSDVCSPSVVWMCRVEEVKKLQGFEPNPLCSCRDHVQALFSYFVGVFVRTSCAWTNDLLLLVLSKVNTVYGMFEVVNCGKRTTNLFTRHVREVWGVWGPWRMCLRGIPVRWKKNVRMGVFFIHFACGLEASATLHPK